MITFEDLRKNESIRAYISRADESLQALGYTEHSFAHVTQVAERAAYVLRELAYSDHEVELAKIAAYLHDIGNLVNRIAHSQSGAILAFSILEDLHMPPEDIAIVTTAIGNHDEGTGVPVNAVAAALILADKSDVRRTRVRNPEGGHFDAHDRVNYSVRESRLQVDEARTTVTLSLDVDTQYSSVMEYFEIFMNRMILCRQAAEQLGLRFRLVINDQVLV